MTPDGFNLDIKLADLVDILIVAVFLYSLMAWFRRSRSAFILIGMLIVGGVYVIGRLFGLTLTTAILQSFFAVFLIAVVIIFQEEIRHFFERVASRSLLRSGPRRNRIPVHQESARLLSRVMGDLASEKIGAIVVLPGHALLERHLTGGTPLQGILSAHILKSIFDPHSAGHDGAVLVDGDRVLQFGCRLPLSTNDELLKNAGLRHAAALGLSERTDALCLLVSEERGTISVAREGRLIPMGGPVELEEIIYKFYARIRPDERSGQFGAWLVGGFSLKLLALFLSAGLWFIFVHESSPETIAVQVPVRVQPVDPDRRASGVDPPDVRVMLSGARRAFYFFDPKEVSLVLRPVGSRPGRRVLNLVTADFIVPEGLRIEHIHPDKVSFQIEAR